MYESVFPLKATSQALTPQLQPPRCCTRSCARGTSRVADAATDLAKATADIQLTHSAREVLDRAAALATARGAAQAEPVDVLKAILESRGTLAAQSIRELGGDPANI